jgi:hypothetical protein
MSRTDGDAAYERFTQCTHLEPSPLLTRQDPDERTSADFIYAAGGVPWTARRS